MSSLRNLKSTNKQLLKSVDELNTSNDQLEQLKQLGDNNQQIINCYDNNANDVKEILGHDNQTKKKFDFRSQFKKRFKENLLLIFTILSVVTGGILGFLLRKYTNLSYVQRQYFAFPGEIFLRMLKFIILPLITSSLICGIAGLGSHKAGKVASRAFIYYFSTTFMAVVTGLVLVISINPGNRNRSTKDGSSTKIDTLGGRKISPIDTILDLIRNLFPDNIIQMAFVQYESKIVAKYKVIKHINTSNSSNNGVLVETILFSNNKTSNATNASLNVNDTIIDNQIDYWYAVGSERTGLNVLGLVMFCLTFGFIISKMGKNGKFLLDLFEAINEAFAKLIGIVMIYSPIGICSLICSAVLNMENPVEVFEKISFYMLTVLVGLFVHGFIVLPSIYLITTRKNIFTYAKNMFEAMLVALATSSSNATLPITFKCIEENNKIPKSISRFVLPVGATINMDGTALYEAVAAIFIAQMNSMNLTFVDYLVTSVTATLASIGAAGVPSAGLVTMVIVLSALNLPQSQISLIYAVDWFLDRFRTMINVWGDSIGAGVVAHLCRDSETSEDLTDESTSKKENDSSSSEPIYSTVVVKESFGETANRNNAKMNASFLPDDSKNMKNSLHETTF